MMTKIIQTILMISTYPTNSGLTAKLESVQQPEGILQTLQFIITTKALNHINQSR